MKPAGRGRRHGLADRFSALDVEPMDEAATASSCRWGCPRVSVLLMSSRWMKHWGIEERPVPGDRFSALDVEPMDEAASGPGGPAATPSFSALDVEPMDEARSRAAISPQFSTFQCS